MSCPNMIDTRYWRKPILDVLGRSVKIPCQTCASCRADKIAHWSVRLEFEALDKPSAFVTLTCDDYHLEYNEGFYEPTLKRSVFHKFIDKLHHVCDDKFTYFGCGEYGDRKGRPHYHLVIFGLDWIKYFHIIPKYWKKGKCDVGPLLSGGCRYVLKYMEKQQFNREFNDSVYYDNGLDIPFVSMSPGIGSSVYLAHYAELLRNAPLIFGSRSVIAPAYWRRKYLHLSEDTVRNSIAVKLAYVRSIQDKARRMNMTVSDYISWYAKLREKRLISRMQKQGVPVYERLVFGNVSYEISQSNLEKYVDMALAA